MNKLFGDTSGWAAWADRDAMFHAQAVAALNGLWDGGGRVVTTNLVLAELTALLHRPLRMPKPIQIQLLNDIRSSPEVEVIFIDSALEAEAWRLWAARQDKAWTLVDCASFVAMQRHGLTEALTSDHHFE